MITEKDIQTKLEELDRLMLGLNAFGSLDLKDYNILIAFIKGSFDYDVKE